jgi:hypothetical protein
MLVEEPVGKCPLGKQRRKWEDNIKKDTRTRAVRMTDGINSGPCPIADFGISSVEPSVSATQCSLLQEMNISANSITSIIKKHL